MAKFELRNQSENEFKDISTEIYRKYRFPSGVVVKIDEPQYLSVSASGGHRVVDSKQLCHYVPAGWVEITWEVPEDKPHFVK